jgi:hypothetical protein
MRHNLLAASTTVASASERVDQSRQSIQVVRLAPTDLAAPVSYNDEGDEDEGDEDNLDDEGDEGEPND